jgi:diguanylate cyclase (GGDEF)-like protein
MGIKAKLLLAFLVISAFLGSASSWLLSQRITRSYQQIERNEAFDDMNRVVGLLEAELDKVKDLGSDWGDWDDLYRYVVDHNQAFYDSNLKGSSYTTTHNNWLAIYDLDGRTVVTVGGDPVTGKPMDFSELDRPDNPYRPFLTRLSDPSPASCGLLSVKQGSMLACRWPIRTSQHQGPIRGTVAMGRLLSSSMVDAIRGRARFDFHVVQSSPLDQSLPLLVPDRIYSRLGIAPVHYRAESDKLMLYWPINDVLGNPQGKILLVSPRVIAGQGQQAVHHTEEQLGFLAGITALALVGVVHLLLVRRLTRLENELRSIYAERTRGARVTTRGQDEIGSLGRHINRLLELIEAHIETLERLSLTDQLTGVANRRAFDNLLQNEILRHRRSGAPLCLLLVDVDHFKLYNDAYGHAAGDWALKVVAECMQAAVQRRTDLVARLGGEEFAVVLAETAVDGARAVAEAIRHELAERAMLHQRSTTSNYLTVSIGIAELSPQDGEDPQRLYQRADAALYGAKGSGRDRAVFKEAPVQSEHRIEGETP